MLKVTQYEGTVEHTYHINSKNIDYIKEDNTAKPKIIISLNNGDQIVLQTFKNDMIDKPNTIEETLKYLLDEWELDLAL
jgi:uncharacterized protein YlzI (FlbEa/FlbD family)